MAVRVGEHGVKAADLESARAALIEFAEEIYGSLARCDQRAKGEQYVRGLLLEGRRKSIQPMAARLPDGDEQGLQQFITDSPWDDAPVRRRLARRMTAAIERGARPVRARSALPSSSHGQAAGPSEHVRHRGPGSHRRGRRRVRVLHRGPAGSAFPLFGRSAQLRPWAVVPMATAQGVGVDRRAGDEQLLGRGLGLVMATSGPDLLIASYHALDEQEQDEAFERLHDIRVQKEGGTESDMARYIRSLQRVSQEVGRTPTADEYRAVQPTLVEAGEAVESFSRVYRFFGSWPRAREALDLSQTATPRRIEARFRERRLGKVWRYDEDILRDTLVRAVEHYGYPPSTTEFDWWREREFELARATGREDPHLPSVTPYRKRWGTWEAALLHFGYSAEEVARRLTAKNNIITRDWDPDAMLPSGLPIADLRDDAPAGLLLDDGAVAKLRTAYAALPRRSRHVLTVRLGLATTELTLKRAATPLALSLDRVRQLQLEALEALTEAVATDGIDDLGRLREAVQDALRALAVIGTT